MCRSVFPSARAGARAPVAQLLGEAHIQNVRQDGEQLRGVAQSGADGVGRVDVVQF